jgi:hypothetical protein
VTYPCVNTNQFDVVDGSLSPKEYLQWRHVASQVVSGSDLGLAPRDGAAKNILIHSVEAQWTNDSPINQLVYAMCSRGPSQVILTARSRATLSRYEGVTTGVAPGVPTVALASRFGVGLDLGTIGVFSYTQYGVSEVRQSARTTPVGATVTLAPGSTHRVRVEMRFVSDQWEGGTINGGNDELEASFACGNTGLDLYAIPVLT